MKKLTQKLIATLGGEGLSDDFLRLTAVHVLLMLGTGLSSVFTSVFLFKMNNSDYVLTAKYTAFMFGFEIFGFILCLYAYKYFSVAKTMQIGLCLLSFAYMVLLILRNNLIDYYILIAALVALGAGFYWFGLNLLMKNYTNTINRQQAVGFNGTCCYIISVIASPISGFITNAFDGITGYIVVFSVTIFAYGLAAYIINGLPNDGTYHPQFKKVSFYILHNKAIFPIYLSDFYRGLHIGMTYYYTPILLYSLTSNEFILGIALMLKQLSAIVTCHCMRNLKNLKQRFLATFIPYLIELCVLFVMIATTESSFMVYFAFFYCSFYNLTDILSSNFTQMPLYESTLLLTRDCGGDREFMPFKQIFLNSGRVVGIVIMLLLPTTANYQISALAITTVLAIVGLEVCHTGAKRLAREINND